MIKKGPIFFFLLFLFPLLTSAQDRYSVSIGAEYGWNTTWMHYGGTDICTHLPFCRHFEADAAFEGNSANVVSSTVSARPVFPIGSKAGSIYLDGTLHNRLYGNSKSADFVMALSAGYRWDYLGIQLGALKRWVIDLEKNSENVREPWDMLYRLWFNVRPASSRWNLGGGVTSFSPYEYERMWMPFFFIDAHYDFNEHFRLLSEVYLKESGKLHLTDEFYGISVHLGLAYRF